MNDPRSILARRYAYAYKEVFGIDKEQLKPLERSVEFFTRYPQTLVMLSLPVRSEKEKLASLAKVFNLYGVHDDILRLAKLLFDDKRIRMLGAILRELVILYRQALGISVCTLTTSHPVTQNDVKIVQEFVARNLKRDSIIVCIVDPTLIAGLRLQANGLVWEYSVRKQLQDMRTALVR